MQQKPMVPPHSARRWQIALLVVFILVPVANYLPMLLDVSQDAFTRGRETRIDAAGYAFSIWGLIFTGMIVFAALQLRNRDPAVHLVRAYRYLILAGLASIAFVPISLGTNYVWGAVDLLWHLAALLGAYFALRRHVLAGGRPDFAWSYFAPSAYLGWVSAATVISITLALEQAGVETTAWRQGLFALALIVTLAGIGLYLVSAADYVYGLTVAWALIAIGVAQRDEVLLLIAAGAGAGLILMAILAMLINRRPLFYPSAQAPGPGGSNEAP